MAEEENLKKLILKSQYIVEEYEETKDKMSIYLQELAKEFPEEHKLMAAKNSKSSSSANTEEIDDEEDYTLDKDKKPESMRKLYRRISKIAHPDKVESEFLNEYFKKASTAYSENNISELITIASFLNIDTSDINKDEIIKELKGDIFTKQFFIANTKSSIAWRWAHAKTEEEKEEIRKAIKDYVNKKTN